MAEPIKFTELTNVGELSLSAIMAIVQQQAGELVSLQCSMAQVAELVASGATFQELTTEQKTLISAINEIAAGGGGGGGAYFFTEGQATAAQIRERYNSGLMCFLIANDDTIYPLTAIDAEYIQGERVEGVFFAKAFGYSDNISVTVKYIPDDAGVEVSSVGFTGVANSRVTNDMSATNGKIPTDDAVRAYVAEYIRTRLAQKLDLDLNNISTAGEQKIRDIAGGGGSGVDPVARAGVEEVKADLTELDNSVDLLYKLTQGQSWDFVDQTEHGMNVAPKGTKVQSLLSVEGKSEQKSTNGYQLLPIINTGEHTDKGLTITTNADGSITLNGTPTSSVHFYLSNGYFSTAILNNADVFHLESGLYNLHLIIKSNVSRLRDINDRNKEYYTGTIPTSDYVYDIWISDLRTYNNEVYYPMLESGSVAHDYEPYTGGIPSPNPDYPQEIVSVEELNFSVGSPNTPYREPQTKQIIPPFPLNKIGDYADLADIERGVWNKTIKTITEGDYTHSIEREPEYFILETPTESPISASDLDYLKSLQKLKDNSVITITDQNGNDITYAMKYLIKLSEAI